MRRLLYAITVAAAAGGAVVVAQDHSMHGAAADAQSTAGYQAANAKMHDGMAIDFSGNADVDFARSMIPHHEGAIAMAEVELQYGSDPELQEMAREIIAAQKGEIATLQAWLKAKGAP